MILTTVLREIATLRRPVTAAAALATVLALLAPLGLHLGGTATAQVTGALAALGVIAGYLETIIARQTDHAAAGGTTEPGSVPPGELELRNQNA